MMTCQLQAKILFVSFTLALAPGCARLRPATEPPAPVRAPIEAGALLISATESIRDYSSAMDRARVEKDHAAALDEARRHLDAASALLEPLLDEQRIEPNNNRVRARMWMRYIRLLRFESEYFDRRDVRAQQEFRALLPQIYPAMTDDLSELTDKQARDLTTVFHVYETALFAMTLYDPDNSEAAESLYAAAEAVLTGDLRMSFHLGSDDKKLHAELLAVLRASVGAYRHLSGGKDGYVDWSQVLGSCREVLQISDWSRDQEALALDAVLRCGQWLKIENGDNFRQWANEKSRSARWRCATLASEARPENCPAGR